MEEEMKIYLADNGIYVEDTCDSETTIDVMTDKKKHYEFGKMMLDNVTHFMDKTLASKVKMTITYEVIKE